MSAFLASDIAESNIDAYLCKFLGEKRYNLQVATLIPKYMVFTHIYFM